MKRRILYSDYVLDMYEKSNNNTDTKIYFGEIEKTSNNIQRYLLGDIRETDEFKREIRMIKNCEYCGKEFEKPKNKSKKIFDKRKFCGRLCFGKYISRKYSIFGNPNIGKKIHSDENKKKISERMKLDNPMFREECKIKSSISHSNRNYEDIYGKEISKIIKSKISLINKGRLNLSKGKTYEDFYGQEKGQLMKLKQSQVRKGRGHPQTPEGIVKIKEARSKQILPKKDTSIEIKIQRFLKDLDIDFFTHQYIKEIEHSYQCDILIPSMNLVIECDGDYWHKYPIGKDIDHIRTKELIEKGFKVLRLWEYEIKAMDLNKFQEKLNEK